MYIISVFVTAITLGCVAVESNVLSCGGFVRSFTPDVYSQLKVKLLTSEGNVKYETDCTPSNGNWFIPIYAHGSYIIRIEAQKGYIFSPSEVPIIVDGKSDRCLNGEDINFQLTSFEISGRVRSGDHDGPRSLKLALYSSSDNTIVATTTTDNAGVYAFEAPPGEYIVSTVDTTQCVERGSVKIKVVDRPVKVEQDLRLAGRTLAVRVLGENGRPLAGVDVHLFSKKTIPFENQINAPKPTAEKTNDGSWRYTLRTTSADLVYFPCLPAAEYRVRASWTSAQATLAFSPAERVVTVAANVEEVKFKAIGFDVTGAVRVGARSLKNAAVVLDKRAPIESAADGRFTLHGVAAGRHTLSATLPGYRFAPRNFEINVDAPQMPLLDADAVRVCGSVNVDDDKTRVGAHVNVHTASDGKLVERIDVDGASGEFCAYLAKNEYRLTPSLSTARLHPSHIDVRVDDTPLNDVVFSEFKASISGRVVGLRGVDCTQTNVVLRAAAGNNENLQSASTRADGSFTFEGVIPGSYETQIDGHQDLCWQSRALPVKVTLSDVSDLEFKQSGFRVRVESTKPATLTWKTSGPRTESIAVGSSGADFCVPSSGVHKFLIVSCYRFKEGDVVTHTVPTTEALQLHAESALVTASILSEAAASASTFSMRIRLGETEREMERQTKSTAHNHTFTTFIEQTARGSEFTILPRSSQFLFNPASFTLKFNGDCALNAFSTHAVEGKELSGAIQPAVGDVIVTALNKKDGSTLTGRSSANGKFKLGLVWDIDDYELKPELEGYNFAPTGAKNVFKSTKLSKLKISYADAATKRPLPEVLMSLSGGGENSNYRSNSVVNADGQIVVVGLPAGEYWIRSAVG